MTTSSGGLARAYKSMKHIFSTRREFLQCGSAAMAAVGGLSAPLATTSAPTRSHRSLTGAMAARLSPARARKRLKRLAPILQQGGNAIDAAAAALLVQCVIEPSNVGLGGYGGSLVYYQAKTGRVHTVDFDSRAPRTFDPATFSEAAGLHGYLAIGTPGVVAGIDLALRQFGTMPFKTLAAPALALAEDGFPVTPKLAASFNGLLKAIDPVSRQAFFPDGVPAEGATWVHADLARLIRRLGDDGPASFYKGEFPRAIARQVQAGGGVLAADDFHDFQATVVEPLHISYRGFDLYTPPLPSGGLTSLSILKTLEQFDVANLTPWGAEYAELFAGASNLAWEERFKYFGDPDFVDVPVEELLSEKRAVERAEIIRKGTPARHSPPDESSHTVNLVVADDEQNIVSWTATHGGDYGAHVAIEGLGLMLGHGMSRFSANPGRSELSRSRQAPAAQYVAAVGVQRRQALRRSRLAGRTIHRDRYGPTCGESD